MIRQEHVIPMLLKACPSFCETWENSDNKDLIYVVMGDLARHLLKLYQDGCVAEFQPLCNTIEQFILEGDESVREIATIGILEVIQNNWAHNGVDPEDFFRFLLSESKKWWKELNDFWLGNIPYVGAGLNKSSR